MNRIGLFLSLSSLVLTLILAGCGKAPEPAPKTPPPPRALLVGNVFLHDDLKSRGLSEKQNCFQVVETPDKVRWFEMTPGACPSEGVTETPLVRLVLQEYIDTERVGVPLNRYFLYDRFLPVGELSVLGSSYLLEQICTNDYFKKSCELRMSPDGVVLSMVPSAAAPTERMIHTVQLEKSNADLEVQLKQIKDNLAKTLERMTAATEKADVHRKVVLSMLGFIIKQVNPVGLKIEAELNGTNPGKKEEEGIADAEEEEAKPQPGLIQLYSEAHADLILLNKSLEDRRPKLHEIEDGVLTAMQSEDDAEKALEATTKQRLQAAQKLEEAKTEEEKKALKTELDLLTINVGEQYSALALARLSTQAAQAKLTGSELFKQDEADRQALIKVKAQIDKLDAEILLKKEVLNDLNAVVMGVKKANELVEAGKLDEATFLASAVLARMAVALEKLKPKA